MYKDNQISLEFYNEYYNLVSLLKQKGRSSTKLDELKRLLKYFFNNYETFIKEEKELIKNVIMIASGIVNNVNNRYGYVKKRKEECEILIENLKDKQKEPTK